MNPDELRERLYALVNDLRDRWDELPEERRQLGRRIGSVLAVVLPLLLIVLPLVAGRISAHVDLGNAQEQLTEIRDMERKVLAHGLGGNKKDNSRNKGRKSSLLGQLNDIQNKLDISEMVQSMRPVKDNRNRDEGTESVEVELNGLVLEELVRYVYEIENNDPPLTIKRFEMQKGIKRKDILRASLEISQ